MTEFSGLFILIHIMMGMVLGLKLEVMNANNVKVNFVLNLCFKVRPGIKLLMCNSSEIWLFRPQLGIPTLIQGDFLKQWPLITLSFETWRDFHRKLSLEFAF